MKIILTKICLLFLILTLINVSNKPIEYSANQIITKVTDRFGADKWQRDEE